MLIAVITSVTIDNDRLLIESRALYLTRASIQSITQFLDSGFWGYDIIYQQYDFHK